MHLDCALLCDAVSVREGLLHILGGGVDRLRRSEFPSPLNVDMALRMKFHPTEAGREHQLELRLLAEDGEEIGRMVIGFGVEAPPALRAGEEIAVMFAAPLRPLPIPTPGAYSFEVLVDDAHQGSIPFYAEVIEE